MEGIKLSLTEDMKQPEKEVMKIHSKLSELEKDVKLLVENDDVMRNSKRIRIELNKAAERMAQVVSEEIEEEIKRRDTHYRRNHFEE